MKFKRLSQEEAEKIIVQGQGTGFSIANIADMDFTIYHRIYNEKYYDIGETCISVEKQDEKITLFYEFDPEEIKQVLGIDPRKTIEADIKRDQEIGHEALKEIQNHEKEFYKLIQKYKSEIDSRNNIQEIKWQPKNKDMIIPVWYEIYKNMIKKHPELKEGE